MKVIVCGGRDFKDYKLLRKTMIELYGDQVIVIVSGGQVSKPDLNGHPNPDPKTWFGTDWLGEKFAEEFGYKIERHKANWDAYGKAAGPIRNSGMANIADECTAFHDGKSSGTADMIKKAKRKGLKTNVIKY